ncbi:MAG: recombinase family protein [Sphingomicrobium sp.]
MTKAPVRCAIYTRKSTEDGLEQEFNSLDAQREACAAYISSQRHEGWLLIGQSYDDGGFSGGNMNRPGLTQLLGEVHAGKVDVIVVYKVDRLTRSLADFAKIVEILDKAGASFVSITQAFNTTTSMGRLTLNVLLSFAQFEREVTGERIRDKIAASKKKGMWMGGHPPLGYDVKDRMLIVNQAEAGTVRSIYRRYLEVSSIRVLVDELRERGVRTKQVGTRSGIWFGRGSLNHLLKNPLYTGEVHFKGEVYAGQHKAILERELFAAVRTKLRDSATARLLGKNAMIPSLLSGVLRDPQGRRMSPTHGCKNGQRYRYYVTSVGQFEQIASPYRFPAPAIERIVIDRLADWLGDASVQTVDTADASELAMRVERARDQATALRSPSTAAAREVILRHVESIGLSDTEVSIHLTADPSTPLMAQLGKVRRGNDVQIIVRSTASPAAPPRNEELVHMLADARAAQQLALTRPNDPLGKLAASAGRSEKIFKRMLRLSYLSPEVASAILEGRQPSSMTCRGLHRVAGIPLSWADQREFFRLD